MHEGFGELKGELAAKPGVHNPGALAAWIGNKDYGKAKMHAAAKAGKPLSDSQKIDKGKEQRDAIMGDA